MKDIIMKTINLSLAILLIFTIAKLDYSKNISVITNDNYKYTNYLKAVIAEEEVEEVSPPKVETKIIKPVVTPSSKPVVTPTPTPIVETTVYSPTSLGFNNPSLETISGILSGYGPDCKGCTGNTASGINVSSGKIYYSDSTYGTIRILSGDKKYPLER